MMTQQQQQLIAGKTQPGKLQPQLLPKPQLAAQLQQQQQQQRLLAPASATVTCGSQFVVNSATGNVLTSLPGTTSTPFFLGQMVGSTAGGGTPFFIQV